MPAVGFGTGIGQADVERHGAGSQGAVTADVVGCALDLGYTAIDTAQRYGTEPYIGAVLA
jgi:diketogulonate reductase-like aldo/keto reductase